MYSVFLQRGQDIHIHCIIGTFSVVGIVPTPLNDGTKGDFSGSASILAFLGNGVLSVAFCIGYNLPEASFTHLELFSDVVVL